MNRRPSLHFFYTNASICDDYGHLLFFSEGCAVMDSNLTLIPNADFANNSELQEYFCPYSGGSGPQSLIVLPFSEDSLFWMVHIRHDWNPINTAQADALKATKISYKNNGLTATVDDSIFLLDNYFYIDNLTACRHANGRDWWVVQPKSLTNGYHTILYEAKGPRSSFLQYVGEPTNEFENASGMSVFSPDGTKYARYTISTDLQIFDFDRCTGLFSNPIHVPIYDAADTLYAAGAAFSASGRFLYVSSNFHIYQFDMLAPDIGASKTTVAEYDFFLANGFLSPFFMAELGPDNKIYVSAPGGKTTIHVIEYPDSAGVACQVVQHKYLFIKDSMTFPIAGGLPHFPNYKLGPLHGSGCDSLTVGVGAGPIKQKKGLFVYPNPASTEVTLVPPASGPMSKSYQILNAFWQQVRAEGLGAVAFVVLRE